MAGSSTAGRARLLIHLGGALAGWLDAAPEHDDRRGPVGLFPAESDPNDRALVSTWIQ